MLVVWGSEFNIQAAGGEDVHVQEAQKRLLQMVGQLRLLDISQRGGFTALADITFLHAVTQHWFHAERDYKVRNRMLAALVLVSTALL